MERVKQGGLARITGEAPGLPAIAVPEASARRRLGQGLAGWGRAEGRKWLRAFDTPAPFGLLLVSLVFLALAWQVPFSYTLDAANELRLDQPFLKNFNAIERTKLDDQTTFFRWSKGEGSLEFPGIGQRRYRLQLTLSADANPRKDFKVFANKDLLAQGQFEPGLKTYEYEIAGHMISNRDGTLRVRVEAQSFSPPAADPRELGFTFFSARLEPQGTGPVVPPLLQLGWLAGVIMLAYTLLARAGFAPWRAAAGAFVLTLALAYLIATPGARPWLTIFPDKMALAFGWALLMVALADNLLRRVWQFRPERRWVLSIFGLALALRLTGLLHPQPNASPSSIIDLGFHINNYLAFWEGGQWWRKIVSTEWGRRETYYPLTTYFLMGWWKWLVPDPKLLNLLWTVTLESSRVLLVYYLTKKVTDSSRSAVLAAFLMAALPINMLSLAWGQTANLMGEWFILVALCMIVVKWEQLRHPAYFVILTLTLIASFIVHPGEVILSGTVFLLAGVLFALKTKTSRQALVVFGACYLLAIVLSFAVYHWKTATEMIPQAFQSVQSRVQGGAASEVVDCKGFRVGGQVRDERMGLVKGCVQQWPDLLTEGARGIWNEARVYYNVVTLVLALGGMGWLWRRTRSRPGLDPGQAEEASPLAARRRRLFWAGVAWLVVFGVFALISIWLGLYVRHWVFVLPYVAIGAGIFLDRLWRRLEQLGRGWAGAGLVVVLGLWLAGGTLALFFDRMIYYARGA